MASDIDQRFAIIDEEGKYRFPRKAKNKRTGKFGFVVGHDIKYEPETVQTIDEVVRAVVFDRKRVRTSVYPPVKGESYNGKGLYKPSRARGYVIAPELLHLVKGAPIAPLASPTGAKGSSASPLPSSGELARTAKPDPYVSLDALGDDVYLEALRSVGAKVTAQQREMLVGHAAASDCTASMQAIAEAAGYADYEAANAIYGRLGSLMASELGVDGLHNKVQAIAREADEKDGAGRFQWVLRPQMLRALRTIGWVEPEGPPEGLVDAAQEIANDPKCAELPETTRKALINARVGQGGFRARMVELWGGRCALTGCAVSEVLIASHALAWADSDNAQRLDEFNGLLLSASVDRLFDRGLVAFADDGALLVSPKVAAEELSALGLSGCKQLRAIHPKNVPYLQLHRQRFGY